MKTQVKEMRWHGWIVLFLACLSGLDCFSLQAQETATIKWDDDPLPAEGVKAPIELKNGEILSARTMPIGGNIAVMCFKSKDSGKTWKQSSKIASDTDLSADIGDGAFLQLPDGAVLYSYRQNHYKDLPLDKCSHSIKVAVSKDQGASWEHHSTVMSGKRIKAGLWSSFLFRTAEGSLQCYYDDEDTPSRSGFNGHQWTQMKTWNSRTSKWINPVTVSRAHQSRHLSRDGMPSVVEIKKNTLVCALESVHVNPPHKGVIRQVTSTDGGKTWSWKRHERGMLYEPKDRNYNSLAPWMIRLSSGTLLCVFVTDEDRKMPDTPSTGKLDEDMKYVVSHDDGKTWSSPGLIDDRHPLYHAGVIELRHGTSRGTILAAYLAHGQGCFIKRGMVGRKKVIKTKPIDLLSKLDLKKDVVVGKWRIQDGSLVSDRTENARIRLPYQPPEEYDFKIVFETEKGNVTQILAARDRQFAWLIGHWDNTKCGFEMVDGKRAFDNATTVRQSCSLKIRQTSEVQVRKDRVNAYFNGRLIRSFKTDFSDLSLTDGWEVGDDKALGLHSWRSSTRFYKIEIVEVTGRGKPVR